MLDGSFAAPDLTTFCRLDGLGLEMTGQPIEPERAVLARRVVERTAGAVDVAAMASCTSSWPGGWRTSRLGGAPRP